MELDINVVILSLLFVAGLWAAARIISNRKDAWIRVGLSPGPFRVKAKAASQYFRHHGRQIVRDGYEKVRKAYSHAVACTF